MKKQTLNSLIKSLDEAGGMRFVIEPQSPFVIDNPDVLVVADNSLFGIYVPTVFETKTFDSLLRRVYTSRLVYARDMKTILLVDNATKEKLSKTMHEAFHRIISDNDIDDVISVINSDKHETLTSKMMLSKHVRTYATTSYYKYINLKSASTRFNGAFSKFKPEWWQVAPSVVSWNDENRDKVIKDAYFYDGSIFFSKAKTKTKKVRESLDSIMTYSMLSQYRLDGGQLHVVKKEPQLNLLNTDLPVFGDDVLWSSSLAYVGVAPVSVDSFETLNSIHEEGLKLFGIK